MNNKLALSPDVIAALEFIQSIPAVDTTDAALAGRQFYEAFIPMAGEAEEIDITERTILLSGGNIRIRIYRPSDQPLLPAVVYFHGGWFNAGSLDTHDRPLRTLAKLSGAVFISVDYRLAPEFPFPHGLQDCFDALQWVVANAALLNIDAARIALAGDSAGAALATATAKRAVKVMNISVCCQVLIYPVTDSSLNTPSWHRYADGPNLTLDGARIAWDWYAPAPADRHHPDAAPLNSSDLTGLPPALIITAEHDPLHDEAVQYAEKLQLAGVATQWSEYPGMVHGFFQMGGIISSAKRAMEEVAGFLTDRFATTRK
ncbi:alpha/beta hydrolase [Chitinophaga sp. 212800010-3]|uniref:alpha/beta hydrolase n=1 Tax=unclassified Chitinophaga TaxID=2619133 RepID=UPI002DE8C14E|nr:Abhydrolase-3 domain-containing protein [Chitinophaga sp. 212800010-3]